MEVMEGNKDEAERCIHIAEKFINEGRREKAEKFLQKAERLYPSQKCKDLLELLGKLNAGCSAGTQQKDPSDGRTRHRFQGNSWKTSQRNEERQNQSQQSSEDEEATYTDEQLEAVKGIKSCKNYYEVLGVSKEATDSDLKRSYRKLALQFHPDKNKAPGAGEAFKAIGNAFAVLSDPEKKKQYDLYGPDEEQAMRARQRARTRNHHAHNGFQEYDFSRGFEADVTAEELFNMFFGGGFPGQSMYVRRGGRFQRASEYHSNQQQREASGYTVFLQMLPILILVFLSMMSSFFVSDPTYSLNPTPKYNIERKTLNLKVPYYVRENFHTDFQGSLRRLEMNVEEDYVNTLRQSCFRERNYKESMLWRARNFGDNQLFRKAQNLRTPSCDTLQNLYAHAS